jgi:uncharacterized protein YfaP (DUF2135 family)
MPKLNAETFTGPLFLLGASLVAMASMVAVVVSSPSEAQTRTVVTLPSPQYTTSSVESTTSSTVQADITPPPIFVNAGVDGATVDNPAFTVAGTTEPGTQLTVNGTPVTADASGNWSLPVTLVRGPNAIPVKATDPAGNQSTLTITVTYATPVATTTTAAAAPPPPAPSTTAKPKPKPTVPPPTTPPPTTPPPTTAPPPVDTGP